MAFRTTTLLILMIAIIISATSAAAQYSTEYPVELGIRARNDDGHGGLVADALDMEEEMMMESESARRQLRGKNKGAGYISYGAMRRGNAPCNQRGQSYYSNCRGHQQANPYSRQCTRATRCARNNH